MSFHVIPSQQLKALIDAYAGPAPCVPPDKSMRFSAEHPYVRWAIKRENILQEAVIEALKPRQAEIESLEMTAQNRVDLGTIRIEVLGQPCLWVNASCSPILGSYLGEVILATEA